MTNPLLDSINESGNIETISVALPTMGRFYEDGVIDSKANAEDIEVRAIGIMAELTTRDPFLLASGKGIEMLIPQICPSILQPSKLAEIDLEAILIAARIATHGNLMVVDHKCSHVVQEGDGGGDGEEGESKVCGEENQIEVNLYDIIMRYAPIEFNSNYIVEFPKYKQKVYLRPIEYGQAMTILKDSLKTMTKTEEFNNTPVDTLMDDAGRLDDYAEYITKQAITTMGGIINSVFFVETDSGDRVFDQDHIKEWLLAISKDDVKEILERATALSKELQGNTIIQYKCNGCGHENTTNIELDVQRLFFFTPRSSKPATKLVHISKKRGSRRTTP